MNGNKIKMDALKKAFAGMGFTGARTVLNTGNVVFTANQSVPELKPLIENVLKATLGYRLARGRRWWTDEQPSAEIKARVEKCLEKENWRIDIVLTHTCPLQYEPTEVFLSGIDQSTVDKSTEEWLGTVERRLSYEKWYCGHYHTSKQIDRLVFMFQDIRTFPVDG